MKRYCDEYGIVKQDTNFIDLSYMREYCGKHHKYIGSEEQINSVDFYADKNKNVIEEKNADMGKQADPKKVSRVAPEVTVKV